MCVYTQMCKYMWAWLCVATCAAQKSISDPLTGAGVTITSWSGFWEPHSGPYNRAASSLNRWATFPALIEISETFCWKFLWGQWSKTDFFEALHFAHGVNLYNFPSLWACAWELRHNSMRNTSREQLPDGSQRLHLLEWWLTLSTASRANPQLWIQTSSSNDSRRRCFSREQAQATVWPMLSQSPHGGGES